MLSFPGAVVRRESRRQSAGDRIDGNLTRCRGTSRKPLSMVTARAAGTSIAMASFWTPLASGHLASFDRRKCKGPLNGPDATGKHCPEGWTLYPMPGPQFQGVTDSGQCTGELLHLGGSASTPSAWAATYRSPPAIFPIRWRPLSTGSSSRCACPYPMGFHAKGMDGRIDDPKAGWKGKGVWSAYAGRATVPYRRR